ncbi:hypothetical protein [Oleisolibacter albus]|uniref:hypothetical protein n=1 Tax=Oleisolibacter albus TaxID=2171757 RepID=UPI000DF44BC8|nr:hypothetical protein [Oleisolibacter albus]
MRVSKWVSVMLWSLKHQFYAAAVLALAVVLLRLPWQWLALSAVLPLLIEMPSYWPRRLTRERWEAVMREPVVHFTTPAQALEMVRDGASRTGGKPGWIHIRPSAAKLDAVGLGGRKAAYAFSGFPSPNVWLRNVGKHATAAIVINPADLQEIRYRTGDGALMLLGGYHGAAEILMVRPDSQGQCMVLEPF